MPVATVESKEEEHFRGVPNEKPPPEPGDLAGELDGLAELGFSVFRV